MKLVRSVQSNMSQSCDDTDDISVATMIRKSSPEHSSDTSDPSLPDLLNSSAHTKTQIRDDKQRPRSCIDPNLTLMHPGFKVVDEVSGTLKKRWSGIHMGSKFIQAFDRLADDTEEEYTDSLEHTATNARLRNPALHEDASNSNGDVRSLLLRNCQYAKC